MATEIVAVATPAGGTVSLAVTGLPAGVSATWSANPVALNPKNSQGIATLTLTASGTASAASGSFTIVASGSQDSATKTVAVQVQ